MTTQVDTLLSLWEAKRQNLQAIADFNFKSAETRSEIMRSEAVRINNQIMADYRRKLNAAETRHRRARAELQGQLRSLNRSKQAHRRHCLSIGSYARASTLQPPLVTRMWTAFIYLGSKSPYQPGSEALIQPFPDSARYPDQFYSPARQMSPKDPVPSHIRRSGEVIEWLRQWGLVPLGNTEAGVWTDGLVKQIEEKAQTAIDDVTKRIDDLQAKRNELDAKHFIRTMKIPESITPKE